MLLLDVRLWWSSWCLPVCGAFARKPRRHAGARARVRQCHTGVSGPTRVRCLQADKEKVAAARKRVFALHAEGKLQALVDPERFAGLGAVPDAIEYMLSGRSIGKVVVRIQDP